MGNKTRPLRSRSGQCAQRCLSLGGLSDGDACPLFLVKALWTGRSATVEQRWGRGALSCLCVGREASPGLFYQEPALGMRAPALKGHDGLAALNVDCTRPEVPSGSGLSTHSVWPCWLRSTRREAGIGLTAWPASPAIGRPLLGLTLACMLKSG